MVYITITSFHINWYANKSYLIDINLETLLTPQIQNPGKYSRDKGVGAPGGLKVPEPSMRAKTCRK